jgi:TP901 family phage tail tape measure protein
MADALPPVIAEFIADMSAFNEPIQAGVDGAIASMDELQASATESADAVSTADTEMAASFEAAAATATESAAEIRAAYAEMGVGDSAGLGASIEEEAVAYQASTDQILASMQEQIAGSQALQAEIDESSAADATAREESAAAMVAANDSATASTEEVGAAMDATSAGLMATVTPWAIAGAAAVAGIAMVVKAGADLQSTVERLATSGGELQSNLAGDTTAIEALAGQVGLSANALATGMYTVTSAGYQGADAIKVLTAAAQGAVTENADLGTVVNAVTDLLNDYHLSASNATQVTSAMITAVSLGKTTFQDLSAAMSIVSPTAANLGISIQELLGDLAEATAHGVSADEAAQQLANTFRSLSNPTSTVTAELGQLGLSSISLSQNLGKTGVSGALEEIQQAILTKMGPAGTVLLSSFNQSKVAAANAATAMSGLGSAAQKVAQQYASGDMAGGFTAWSNALKGLSAPQANLLNQWKALQDSSNGFSNALKSGGGDVQSYTQALAKATGNASTLQTSLVLTGQNFTSTSGDITKIKTALDGTSKSVTGFAEQQQTLNAKLNDAKAGFGALVDAVGEKLLPIITKLVSVFATVAEWLAKHQQVATALAYVIGGVLVVALAALAIGMAAIAIVIVPLIQGAQQLISHWSDISGFFTGLWKDVSGAFNDGVDAVKDAVKWFEGLPDDIGGFFSKLPGVLGRAASGAGTALLNGIKTAGTDTLNFLKNLPAESGHALGELAGTLARQAVDAGKAFYTGITTGFTDTVHFFENLPTEIKNFLVDAQNWLDDSGHKVVTGFINGITAEAVTFWNWLTALPGNILRYLGDAQNWLDTTGRSILRGLFNGIVTGAVDVWNWLTALPGNVLHWLGDASQWLDNAGLNIIKGLWSGIQSGASWLMSQIKNFASGVISGFESAFGIHSPSTITYQHGLYLVQGYANAIRDNAGLMVSAATGAANKTLGAFAGRGASLSLSSSLTGSGGASTGGGTAIGGTGSTAPTQLTFVISAADLEHWFQTGRLQYNLRNSGNGLSISAA